MLEDSAWVSLHSKASHRGRSSVVTRRRGDAKKTGVRFAPFEALPLRVHFLLSSPPLHSKRAITHP